MRRRSAPDLPVERASDGRVADPREALVQLFQDLRSSPEGLSGRDASRRLTAYGPNELLRRGGAHWPEQLAKQLTHPLALLLWVAAALAFAAGTPILGAAIVAVILLNAVFAFAQERQAERAIEALRSYLPQQATVLRDGQRADRRGERRSFPETCSCSPRAIASPPTRACSTARSRSTCRR